MLPGGEELRDGQGHCLGGWLLLVFQHKDVTTRILMFSLRRCKRYVHAFLGSFGNTEMNADILSVFPHFADVAQLVRAQHS